MGSLISLIFPAVLPAVTDGLRGLFAKFTGGAGGTPQNVAERIQLMQAETERLKALSDIDKPSGETSLWVNNVRGVFRYAAISTIWITTAIAVFTPSVPIFLTGTLLDLSGATMSFIIGERMYFNLKTK
jgi:hypothetical protein